jgi:acetyl-CoA carboxylase beta subunit
MVIVALAALPISNVAPNPSSGGVIGSLGASVRITVSEPLPKLLFTGVIVSCVLADPAAMVTEPQFIIGS